jgi:chemotaxis protein CheZ
MPVSDLTAGADALDHLDERVKRLSANLADLGWDVALRQLLDEIPDARERLRYVGQMTEDAAMKVLNMVDESQPACQAAARSQGALAERLEALLHDPDASPAATHAALADAAAQLRQSQAMATSLAETLTSIMLAQDFQDLSGQVIKKVVAIIGHTEDQLGRMLAEGEGAAAAPLQPTPTLQGPQVPEKAVAQADVDDLLASLGF